MSIDIGQTTKLGTTRSNKDFANWDLGHPMLGIPIWIKGFSWFVTIVNAMKIRWDNKGPFIYDVHKEITFFTPSLSLSMIDMKYNALLKRQVQWPSGPKAETRLYDYNLFKIVLLVIYITNLYRQKNFIFYSVWRQNSGIHSFIHYGDLYSAPSRLLLRSAPDPCTAKKKSFESFEFW